MTDLLQATYADLKTVKTRSSLQLILEMPIEALTDVVALLGAPVPGNEVWVAVARLRGKPEALVEQEPEPEAHQIEGPANDDEQRTPKPLSQIAAILCNIVAFRRFIHEKGGFEVVPSVDEAATWVREKCGVQSRREFDTDTAAAANFRRIRADYDFWMRAA